MSQENSVLDRTIREFLDKLAVNEEPLVYQVTPEQARNALLRTQLGAARGPDVQIKGWNVASTVGALRIRTMDVIGVRRAGE